MFNNVFYSTLERHAPIMTIKVRNRPCPYVTQEIKALMNERDKLHRKFQLSRNIKDWQTYKDARTSVKNTLKDCEKNYVMKIINASYPIKRDQYMSTVNLLNRLSMTLMSISFRLENLRQTLLFNLLKTIILTYQP